MEWFKKNLDFSLLLLLISVVVGIPFGVRAYDHQVWRAKIPREAKVFTLTGHAQKGWLLGDVHAYDAVSLWRSRSSTEHPVIEVSKGDFVVLKLRSSDVVHGFSLKEYGVFVNEGIQPGKTVMVSFKANRVGRFVFSCNAICGENHQNMQGVLVVSA